MTSKTSLIFVSSLILSGEAFTVSRPYARSSFVVPKSTSSVKATQTPYFLDEVTLPVADVQDKIEEAEVAVAEVTPKALEITETPTVAKKVPPKKKKGNPHAKEGVFSPIVRVSKKIVGDDRINQLRGKIISLHSSVIGDFVDTHTTPLGSAIAQRLFEIMDDDNSGALDKDELKTALQALGFEWLGDKQIDQIMKRADSDGNGVIDYDEFEAELSKTLRVNLIKLAKKNGTDMGLLV